MSFKLNESNFLRQFRDSDSRKGFMKHENNFQIMSQPYYRSPDLTLDLPTLL